MKRRSLIARGHTLIELSIALALGLLIIAACLSLYRAQRAAFDRAADAARMHDAGVTALNLLGQHIQMAGFDATDAMFGCSQGRVIGAESTAACESLSGHSDGVQVRYSADAIATWPSSSGTPTDCLGQAVTDAFVSNRFYAKASTSSGEPELYCEGGGKQAQPMVEGVERIGLTYWLDGSATAVAASAIPRERWRDVQAVDVCVLVRGYLSRPKSKASYVDCNGAMASADDGRTRQPFWRRIAIRNSASESTRSAT
jgi:type IV pilus assembly protein PilW